MRPKSQGMPVVVSVSAYSFVEENGVGFTTDGAQAQAQKNGCAQQACNEKQTACEKQKQQTKCEAAAKAAAEKKAGVLRLSALMRW